MAETIKGINVVIGAETTGLSKALSEVNKRSRDIQSELKQVDRLLKIDPKNTELLAQKQRLLAEAVVVTREKLDSLKAAQQQVNEQFAKGEINEGQYRAFQRELEGTEGRLKTLQDELKKTKQNLDAIGESMKKAGQKMTEVGGVLTKGVTVPLAAVGASSLKAAADFESAFAGVRKTVDATEEELAVFEQGIRDMAKEMPQAATEIAGVAEAAGQLGIQNDAILSFTETMVNMGVATNMSSEDAATALARFANITKMSQQDFDRLGSSVVGLGNNFATTEQEIVEMALRLAGAGSQIGMSEADILGLAAALSSVGIEAEMGGSAMSRVMVRMQVAATTGLGKVQELSNKTGLSLRDMQLMAANAGMDFADLAQSLGMTKGELKAVVDAGADLENFAKVAGMNAVEFKEAFEVDAVGALGAFINGLGNAEAAGESAINMLQEMGITEIRLRDSLLRAGNANELFADAVKISNEAWEENMALTNEANERYKTFDSQLKMLWNRIKDVGITIGSALIPILINAMKAVQPMIDAFAVMATWFAKLNPAIQQIILVILGLVAALGPALVIVGQIVSSIGTLLPLITSLAPVFAALTGPIGIAIAAVAALAAGLTYLYHNNETVRDGLNAAWEAIKTAAQTIFGAIKEFWEKWGDDILAFFKKVFDIYKTIWTTIFKVVWDFIKFIFNEIKAFWDEWGDTIVSAFKAYFEILKIVFTTVFGIIFERVKKIFNDLKAFWDNWGGVITNVFKTIFNIVKSVFEGTWNTIKIVVETAIGVISGIIQTWLSIFKGDWSGAWENAKSVVTTIWEGIKGLFKNSFETMKNIGKDIIEGLINGIKGMKDAVVNTAKDIATSIFSTVKDVLQIKSPSRVMTSLGEHSGQGLANGLKKKKKAVQKSAEDLAKKVYEASKEWIDERKYYNELSLEQELAAWERIAKRYNAGTEQRKQADREVYRVKQELIKAEQQADKDSFDNSKKWIDNKKRLSLLSLAEELAAWERVQSRYKEGSEEYLNAQKEAASVRKAIYDELKSASDDYLSKVKEVNERVAAEEKRLNEVYEQALESRTNSIYSFAGLFDEVKSNAEVSGAQLIENLRGQIDAMTEWSQSLKSLAARGVDDGLIAELEQMGPRAAAEIAALNSLTDTELNRYESLWKTKNELAREQAISELEGLRKETIQKIQELNRGAETELEKLQKEFETRVSAVRTGTKNEFNALTADMPEIGRELINGLIKGMDEMKGKAAASAKSVADSVAGSMKEFFAIKSPSRLMMGYGKNVVQGLANGISDTAREAVKSASAVSSAVAGAMSFDASGVSSAAGAALQGGGSQVVGNTTNNFADMFRGANFVVRNDNDIKLISQEIGGMFTQRTRGLGGAL